MNTLDLYILLGLVCLSGVAVVARWWRRSSQHHITQTMQLVSCGASLVYCVWMTLHLATHPADIESLTEVFSGSVGWFLASFIALSFLAVTWPVMYFLVRLGRLGVLGSLLQRVTQRR